MTLFNLRRIVRVIRVCEKVRDDRDATRLWNWIDHQMDGDLLWKVMAAEIPWAFRNPKDVNSIRFTY